jgi:phosphatidylinositol-3,4,5-trisphosphate 3-phosphatase/dual-specificity protein phosphatase PTEN
VEFCEDACRYLAEHESNIVVVHCKAGKGRTGVMIASLLLKLGIANDPFEAIKIYGDQRTVDGNGITIPSQRRYVYYYDSLLKDPWTGDRRKVVIQKINLLGRQNAIRRDGMEH